MSNCPPAARCCKSKFSATAWRGRSELLAERPLEGGAENGTEQIYQWDLALPTDPRDLIEVMAGTDAPTAAFGDVVVQRKPPEQGRTLPEMHVLCAGINRYADPKINTLGYPVADAEAVADAFRKGAAGLYHVSEVTVLENQQVTPAAWTKALAESAGPPDGPRPAGRPGGVLPCWARHR